MWPRISLILLTMTAACRQQIGPSAYVTDRGASARTLNGHAADWARIDPEPHECIVLPAGSVVESTPENLIVLRMRKEIQFYGHPPRAITPLTARRCMGVAQRVTESGCLEIGIFGEWANPEGHALVDLRVEVPRGLTVTLADDLAGSRSRAANRTAIWWIRNRAEDPEFWYAAAIPADGWSRIPDVPDPTE